MKLKQSVEKEVRKHAEEEHAIGRECCGIMVKDKYIRCENISAEDNSFEISVNDYAKYMKNDTLQAIVHSHNNDFHLSKEDMVGQIKTSIPWGIVNVVSGTVRGMHFWGDSLPVKDLIGREFIHGSQDCYGLVRDYYKKEKDIKLKQYPRDNYWWSNGGDLLSEENFKETGFYKIDSSELEVGDVVLFSIRANVVNHSAIYIGNGEVLHHLSKRLSRREPIHIWNKYIVCFLKYKGE